MKVLVLGCGNIGSVAAEDLAKSINSLEVVVADVNKTKAKDVAEKIGRENVSWIHVDATDQNRLGKTLNDYDLIMGFLPGNFGYSLIKACINAEKNLVDVSFMPENPLTLNSEALKANVTIIPDCGLAPGISNVLVGHAAAVLDKAKRVHIMVGGLPEKPVPPLDYIITWSPENLIDEYTRKARIIRRGREVEVEALSGVEEVEFPNFGRLEAFYTDGLRTLLDTIKTVEDMWEKTLRYVGHAEKVKLLKELGFFEEEQINIRGIGISPKKLTAKLFERKLWRPEVKDVVALKVEVSGIKEEREKSVAYHLLDYYDKKRGITAMARTTAFTASIIAQFLLKKMVKDKGVVPPEIIGKDEMLFQTFLKELDAREVRISEEETVS